jgi:hypothetical protein
VTIFVSFSVRPYLGALASTCYQFIESSSFSGRERLPRLYVVTRSTFYRSPAKAPLYGMRLAFASVLPGIMNFPRSQK